LKARQEHELSLVQHFIKKLGTQQADGTYVVKFGVLFKDEEVANTFEALAGTLKQAKRTGIITYKAPLLLQGMSDDEDIILLNGSSQ